MDVVDETLPQEITDFIWCFVSIMANMLIMCIFNPSFMAILAVLFIVFGFTLVYYIGSSRQLKRLESIGRSPILSHFQETLSGTSSIRFGHYQ